MDSGVNQPMPSSMSEDQKFRLSLTLTNVLMLGGMIVSGILTWTTLVQKYDDLSSRIAIITSELGKLENESTQLDRLEHSLEATVTRVANQEQREMVLEGKVDALTQLLNQFIGTVNRPPAQPRSTPDISPHQP